MDSDQSEPASRAESPRHLSPAVLLVDDRHETRLLTKWFLSYFGYNVDTARSAEEALSIFNPRLHDIVVTDNVMPGITGAELARLIKRRSGATPVLMYTGRKPSDCSCVDFVIERPAHLLIVDRAIKALLSDRP
jgi:DNA-binding response OmpR family regulator